MGRAAGIGNGAREGTRVNRYFVIRGDQIAAWASSLESARLQAQVLSVEDKGFEYSVGQLTGDNYLVEELWEQAGFPTGEGRRG